MSRRGPGLNKQGLHETRGGSEIGGGYGGLAHHLGGILAGHVTYVIVDLPEMFLFQAPYLRINNPGKSIYVWDRASFTPEFVLQDMNSYDFVLIPNFALEQLEPLTAVAAMINMQSFQEMNEAQVDAYLRFGATRITHYLYSDNVDAHPYNEDLSSVSALLAKHYDLHPEPEVYDRLFARSQSWWTRYYKKYIGIPKGSGRSFPALSSSLAGTELRGSAAKRLMRNWAPMFARRAVRRVMGY